MNRDAIRVVVADDSPFIRRLVRSYLTPEAGFSVVAEAGNGIEAVEAVQRWQPDVLTLDLEMPEMDGLEALRTIMQTGPIPVVAISGVSGRAATRTLQALDAGAVDFVLKFTPGVAMDPETLAREVVEKTRMAAGIEMVGRQLTKVAVEPTAGLVHNVVVIGASTGGPMALRELLSELPGGFNGAVVVVQHIPAFFTGVLAAQLNRYCRLPVREAEEGETLAPGVVYVAPGGYHFLLQSGLRIHLQKGADGATEHCPSIDVAMESAARLLGARVVGVLLSGMGADGAAGLLAVRRNGGRTYAQDESTSAVFGMPRRAIELGAAMTVESPAAIGAALAAGGVHARG
jgi:two-component system chemotaxis response regulator CheB